MMITPVVDSAAWLRLQREHTALLASTRSSAHLRFIAAMQCTDPRTKGGKSTFRSNKFINNK